MFLGYMKFLGVTGVVCSTLLAEGGSVRAAKEVKAVRDRVAPDENFGSTSTEPPTQAHVVEKEVAIKGRASKYLVDGMKAEPVKPSAVGRNHHLKPLNPNELQIERLLRDANAAVLGSKEEAENLSAASILLHESKQLKEAADVAWKAATIYYKSKYYDKAARAFSKSAFIFDEIHDTPNAILGYTNSGKLYKDNNLNGYAAAAFKKAGLLYEGQKQYTEALKFFKLSSSAFLEAKDYNEAIDLKWVMVDIYGRAKDYKKAAFALKEIAAIHQNHTKNFGRAAEALVKAGYYFRDAYIFDDAERSFSAALIIYRDLKLEKPERQVMDLVDAMNTKAQELRLADRIKFTAQKKYLALQKNDLPIELHNREELQDLYTEAGKMYKKLGIASESAKAFRNAGSFSTAVTNRITLFELAAAEYKKVNMNAEMRHMEEQVGRLLTPKEQMPLKVMDPLV